MTLAKQLKDSPLKSDPWLSALLQKQVYSLNFSDPSKAIQAFDEVKNKAPQNKLFVYTKIPTHQISSIEAVEKVGFYLVDTNVSFEKTRIEPPKRLPAGDLEVRFANTEDKRATADLAARCFKTSRFHLDPRISNDIANKIKSTWVENFFNGNRGQYMILALENSQVVGFLQIIYNETKLLSVIDLIGVDPDYQGKGIGTSLLLALEKEITRSKQVLVGTQISNYASLRLYQKLGFRYHSSSYVFHYHSD